MAKQYDVFLSFKNLGSDGKPTRDSLLAKDIYEYLLARKVSVFLSTIELEARGISTFKKAIDRALDVSRVLVAIGTSIENLESDWVRYEWDSFFSDIISGVKPDGRVFSYLDGVEFKALPRALRQSQAITHRDGSFELLYRFVANALNFGVVPAQVITKQRSDSDAQAASYFSFGRLETTWVVVDGDGVGEYLPQNIRSHYNPRPDPLPADLLERRRWVEEQQQASRHEGRPFQWNGDRYSLDSFIISRDILEEAMVLDLWFRPTDYYTYLATNMALGDTALREKYLQGADWHSPVRSFSNSFGVSIAVVTVDNYTLLVQRGRNLGSQPNTFNISVSEGLSRPLDSSTSGLAPDVYRCASRGLTEELGLIEGEDFSRSDIIFLSFGVDTKFSQWGLRGMVRVQKEMAEIVSYWVAGVKDKIENAHIFPLEFKPEVVASFVFSHDPWSSASLVCLYHALIHEFDRKRVREAMASVI